MKIIEKIEIKNFRSFLGTKKIDKAIVHEVTDLNIFSGSNDSGKSNILRAINLFFTDEIDSTHKFNFSNDFTLLKEDAVQKVIEIKIYFYVSKNRRFSISKFYTRDGYRNFEYFFEENGEQLKIDQRPEKNEERYGEKGKSGEPTYKSEHPILKQEKGKRTYVTQFLKSISFSYVPAIRDERFFSHLYGKIILQIKDNEEKEIEKLISNRRKIADWEKTLKKDNETDSETFKNNLKDKNWRKSELAKITKKINSRSILQQSITDLEKKINEFSGKLFESASFLDSEFKIGNNLKEFFESFDIGTGANKHISLRLRGDGIQAKFIPLMLNELDNFQSKKYSIWGFEEPENSAEYKNQRLLAEAFKNKYSEEKQIFLTTHSEEFLSIYDGSDIEKDKRRANLYHVKKVNIEDSDEFSIIELFDVEESSFEFATTKSGIEEDIGSSLIRAKYSKELKEKEDRFLEEKGKLEEEKLKTEKNFAQQIAKLENFFPENIFICEDENGVGLWENLFEKYDIEDLTIIPSKGCTVNDVEIWIRENRKRQTGFNPKVFRSLDRDGYTQDQIDFLESELKRKNEQNVGNDNYRIKFLPVNEIENFAILTDDFFTDELLKDNLENLEDKFIKTITSSLNQNNRKFGNSTELFNRHQDDLLIKNMEREAKEDLKKYFPGKDIKALKNNFNVRSYLKRLSVESFPQELKNYLEEIRSFFDY